nr:hypothetical protein [uncultured Cohaesibacter sp.]
MDLIATMAVPIMFVYALFFAPTGVWKMGTHLKSNDCIRQSMEAAQQVEIAKIFDKFVTEIESSEIKKTFSSYQLQKLQSAISYTINRHDWYEEQRSGLVAKHLTLSALVFTVIGLYIGQQKNGISSDAKLIILSTGLLVLISLLYSIFQYNSELDQDRPYRLVSDIRFW